MTLKDVDSKPFKTTSIARTLPFDLVRYESTSKMTEGVVGKDHSSVLLSKNSHLAPERDARCALRSGVGFSGATRR
jgi:hypothetical protein